MQVPLSLTGSPRATVQLILPDPAGQFVAESIGSNLWNITPKSCDTFEAKLLPSPEQEVARNTLAQYLLPPSALDFAKRVGQHKVTFVIHEEIRSVPFPDLWHTRWTQKH